MADEDPQQTVTKTVMAAKRPFIQIAKHSRLGLEWEPEAAFAYQALKKSAYLATCKPESIRDAIVNVASIGLSLNPALQHAALVPRWTKGAGVLCCLDPMYRGLIHLAIEGGNVISVRADVVRQIDLDSGNFQYVSGTSPAIIHNPNPFMSEADKGEIVGAYVVAEIRDSKHPHITVIGKDRLDQIRGMSETWKKDHAGPWRDHPEEMAKKTVIKMGAKTWGTGNSRVQTAIALANVADGYDVAIDCEATAVASITNGQAEDIRALARKLKVPVERIYKLYEIKAVEELPADKLDECQARIFRSGAIYALKNAKDNELVVASDYLMTIEEMNSLVLEVGSKARTA
jgi:recombination protein RecT